MTQTGNHKNERMEEPSVLDYIKSILKNWESFKAFARSILEPSQRPRINRLLDEQARALHSVSFSTEQEVTKTRKRISQGSGISAEPAVLPSVTGFPWRSLLAVLLSILGQAMMEPPGRKLELGIPLYLAAFGFVVWAALKGEWSLENYPRTEHIPDPLTVRSIPLVLGTIFAIWAFIDFSGNLFTWRNLLLWILAVGSWIFTFWLRRAPDKRN